MADIQVGSTVIVRRTMRDQAGAVIDISGATTQTFYFKLANSGKLITAPTTFTTTGIDGQHQATISSFDKPGMWTLQAYLVIAGQPFWSEQQKIAVKENIAP